MLALLKGKIVWQNLCSLELKLATISTPDLLQRVPLFENISHSQAVSLMGALEKRRFKKSEHIVDVGQKSESLFIILSGTARVVLTNDKGREIVLATLGIGECIGEMSLLDNQPHSATVVASSTMDALMLSSKAFNDCIMHNAPLAVSVMRGLVKRLRQANQKIASLALISVYGRVARHLIEIADVKEDGDLIIAKKISSVALARELGASREMVSKALKDFEKQKFIEKLENGHLLIHERRATVRA